VGRLHRELDLYDYLIIVFSLLASQLYLSLTFSFLIMMRSILMANPSLLQPFGLPLFVLINLITLWNSQLKKWNERWVKLDPTTGKIEYKYGNYMLFSTGHNLQTLQKNMIPIFGICRVRRSDSEVRGVIVFDSTSTVILSPMNFQYVLCF
jgi:hypothetical protein